MDKTCIDVAKGKGLSVFFFFFFNVGTTSITDAVSHDHASFVHPSRRHYDVS